MHTPHFSIVKTLDEEYILPKAKTDLWMGAKQLQMTASGKAKILVSFFLMSRDGRAKLAKCDTAPPNAVLEQLSVFIFLFLSHSTSAEYKCRSCTMILEMG